MVARTLAFPHLVVNPHDSTLPAVRQLPDHISCQLLDFLMLQLDRWLPLMSQIPPRRDGPYKFLHYFRTMLSITSSAACPGGESPFATIFGRHTSSLVNALVNMNDARSPCTPTRITAAIARTCASLHTCLPHVPGGC